jgi:hypothetical protein
VRLQFEVASRPYLHRERLDPPFEVRLTDAKMLPDAKVRDGMFLPSASSLASLLIELTRLELQEFGGFF